MTCNSYSSVWAVLLNGMQAFSWLQYSITITTKEDPTEALFRVQSLSEL